MSDHKDLLFAQMLGSRLCHDLITPVSAVNSGLELLEGQDGDNLQEIYDLIAKSAKTASHRLSFYRFAFGSGGVANLKTLTSIRPLVEQYLDPNKFNLVWNIPDDTLTGAPDLKNWAKLLTNMILCTVEAAPFGGTITVAIADQDDINLITSIDTSRIAIADEVCHTIESGTNIESATPRTIQAFLIWKLLSSLHRRIIICRSNEKLELRTQLSAE